jgi:eukaryotic-like serine/threonine-protein kinase
VRARHETLDQLVAIKLVAPEVAASEELVLRLLREARAAAKVRSEHVVRVLDVGVLPGEGPYMVMELLQGQSLAELCAARGTLPVAEAVDYALEALEALAEVHELGIVHRDLKPSNLFLAEQPDGRRILKVLDFGISKVQLAAEPTADLTSSRALLGTPLYMSPEQLKNPRDVDARADLWSLGVVIYRMLAGRPPFAGESVTELCFSIAETRPASLRGLRGEIPAGLDRLVLACLERQPAARPADARALQAALAPFGSGRVRPRGAGARSRRRALLAGAGVVALGAAGLAALALRGRSRRPAVPAAAAPSVARASIEPPAAPSAAPVPIAAPPRPAPVPGSAATPAPHGPPARRSRPAPRAKTAGAPPASRPAAEPNLDRRY